MATKITKSWATGDQFTANDQEALNKDTINSIIDDNEEYHILQSGSSTGSIENDLSVANGVGAVAFGNGTYSNGDNSLGFGFGNIIGGDNSFTNGHDSSISGNNSGGIGASHNIHSNNSLGVGSSCFVVHENALVVGDGLVSKGVDSITTENLYLPGTPIDDSSTTVLGFTGADGKICKMQRNIYGSYLNTYKTTTNLALFSTTWVDVTNFALDAAALNAGLYELSLNMLFDTRYADTRLEVQILENTTPIYISGMYPIMAGSSIASTFNITLPYVLATSKTLYIKVRVGDNVDDLTIRNIYSTIKIIEQY